jgi:asparagine synthase (glutamine-hydrolysing)
MCGITGILAFNQIGAFYMVNLGKSIEKLSKRGPDARGSYIEDFLALGHRRLSIIDTSFHGAQPMKDDSERYIIVFNGEIFNYKELKRDLEDKGVSFNSECDTEVLLKLYILEGRSCLEKLIGFFAFAIYDKQSKDLFIARDRMGIKPLLYYYDEDKFVFASEMKSLLAYNIPREIDYTSLYQYLQLNYIPGPASMIKNVRKLKPGNYILIKDKKVQEGSYYNISFDRSAIKKNTLSYEAQQEQLIALMDDSVKRRLIADVPLGAFLSGGIDSSVIVALASKHTDQLNTFSIGYRDEPFFDETSYAELVAKKYNTNHTVFSLSNDDLFANLFEALDYIDEPFADSSALAVYILSKHTTKKVKVALSGDGADELFAGYNKHMGDYRIRQGGMLIEIITWMKPLLAMLPKSRNSALSNKIRQLYRLAEGAGLSNKERYWRWCSFAGEDQATRVLSAKSREIMVKGEYDARKKQILKHFSANGDMNELLRTDMDLVLANDMLFKVDMMSMANGLEVRVPFLDHRVVDFAFSLPLSSKIDGKMKKKIVQDAFREVLPPELYNRPKHGFEVPLLKWMRRELRSWVDEMLDEKLIVEQGIFNFEEIRKIKTKLYSSNPEDSHARVWGLLVFQHWWKKYIKS